MVESPGAGEEIEVRVPVDIVDPAGSVAGQMLVFGIIDVVLGLVWWTVFVIAAGQFGRLLERPRIRVRVDIATGAVLTVLGLLIPVV